MQVMGVWDGASGIAIPVPLPECKLHEDGVIEAIKYAERAEAKDSFTAVKYT